VAAFFESFQEHVGKEFFGRLKITDAEKETLIARRRGSGETIYDVLYAAEIPVPSPTHGFEENVGRVETWCTVFTDDLSSFLHGLSVAENARFGWGAIIYGAVERYRSLFLALAAQVPEFMIWVLLALDAARGGAMPDLRAAVARANSGVLGQQIIREDAQGYGPDITFPTTGDIAQEIFDGITCEDRGRSLEVLEVLEVLLGSYRYRHGSDRYAGYRPMPPDRLRELACYSANLVTLAGNARTGTAAAIHFVTSGKPPPSGPIPAPAGPRAGGADPQGVRAGQGEELRGATKHSPP
jgi:hypothetical protein